MVLFFAQIPFVVNRVFSSTPAERLQQYGGELAENPQVLMSTKQ